MKGVDRWGSRNVKWFSRVSQRPLKKKSLGSCWLEIPTKIMAFSGRAIKLMTFGLPGFSQSTNLGWNLISRLVSVPWNMDKLLSWRMHQTLIWNRYFCFKGYFLRLLPWKIIIKPPFGEHVFIFLQPPSANLRIWNRYYTQKKQFWNSFSNCMILGSIRKMLFFCSCYILDCWNGLWGVTLRWTEIPDLRNMFLNVDMLVSSSTNKPRPNLGFPFLEVIIEKTILDGEKHIPAQKNRWKPTPPKFNSSLLENDGWKTTRAIFRGELLNFQGVFV